MQKNTKEASQEQEAAAQAATTASGENSAGQQTKDPSKDLDGSDENIIDKPTI